MDDDREIKQWRISPHKKSGWEKLGHFWQWVIVALILAVAILAWWGIIKFANKINRHINQTPAIVPAMPANMQGRAISTPTNAIVAIMDAIIWVESRGDPNVPDGKAGERGICQIMRGTWEETCRYMGVNWDFDMAYDPIKNRAVGTAYFVECFNACNGQAENAIRSYNAGIRGGQLGRGKNYLKLVKERMEAYGYKNT